MKSSLIILILLALMVSCQPSSFEEAESKKQLEETSKAIRTAFKNGNVDSIMLYHHPDVMKVFSFDEEPGDFAMVKKGLEDLLVNNEVHFEESEIESRLINDNTSILQTKFKLFGKVKSTGEEWSYEGRTMVVSVKYDKSPTGWATIREIVQPAQ
ncbi:hypothetical protein [Ekhidna sp.]